MEDVILIAVIVAFFAVGAFLVRAIDAMIANAGHDADAGEDEAADAGDKPEAELPGGQR